MDGVMPAKTAPAASADQAQWAIEIGTFRRLWLGLEDTQEAIARSVRAYRESRELLRRLRRIDDGGPSGSLSL